jgi:hypothetical protein
MLARSPRLAIGMSLFYLGFDKKDIETTNTIPNNKKSIQKNTTHAILILLVFAVFYFLINMPFNKTRPLHLALAAKNYQLANILLYLGANPNGNDLEGVPPISDVIWRNDITGAELLFKHGVKSKMMSEHVPSWLENSSPEMKALFRKHGIEPPDSTN